MKITRQKNVDNERNAALVTKFMFSALNRKLYRDLWHLRGQVAATALVVACGVASFVAMQSTYRSLRLTQDDYYAAYRFADVFAHLKRAPESLRREIENIAGVSKGQTRVVAEVTVNVPGLAEPAQGKIVSVEENQKDALNDLHFLRGTGLNPNKADEIVVSGAFADANNFNPGDSLEAIINGRWRRLRIVGVALSPEYVYEIRPGDIFPDNRRFGILWMNRQAVASAFEMNAEFNDVAVTLAPGGSEAAVIEELDRMLKPYGGGGAYGRGDQQSHRFLANEFSQLEVFGTFLPAIFLGVTAFLLHLVLSRLVNTEREQIGLLKAFGYGNAEIGGHFLLMAFVTVAGGVVGGVLLGMWLGAGMTGLYADFFRFPLLRYEAGWRTILLSFVISFGAASVGAISAVRKAVNLPPAEAMRPEVPANFRRGFLEKIGLQRFVSPAFRIVFRNLSRQPLKAALTTLGISLAVALLFTGFYFFDAIGRVIEIQFAHVVREDVNVIFNQPRPGKTRYELAKLPGVLSVETFRAVPARLRFGHRSRRVGLLGAPAAADLHRIVDADFRVIHPPTEGIILTGALADSLGIAKGDFLTLEILEGSRPVREIEVVGTIDEIIGLNAYLEISALNRLLREGDTISGAYLSIDSSQEQKLFSELKKMPQVGGVGLPGAALKSFNETMGQTIGTFTFVLSAFASVIVFGVVYNGARIALSERGRELASLRVLGFTQREIGVILLGEQAILTLVAVPLGWVFGYFVCLSMNNLVDREILRLPLVFTPRSFIASFLIVLGGMLVSGLFVAWRLRSLDLIEVLKTRE